MYTDGKHHRKLCLRLFFYQIPEVNLNLYYFFCYHLVISCPGILHLLFGLSRNKIVICRNDLCHVDHLFFHCSYISPRFLGAVVSRRCFCHASFCCVRERCGRFYFGESRHSNFSRYNYGNDICYHYRG